MTDFFDWLTVGDSGLGTDRLADAFNLSHEEVRGTADALAPAFTLALQRAMTNPAIWQDLSRRFAPLMARATAPGPETAASSAATDFSDTLFGSPDVSAAIARKVSLARGIAPDAVEQLMRNLSVMTMQTMVQMMLANMARGQPRGLSQGDYPAAVAEMMRRGANAVEALGRPADQGRRTSLVDTSSEALTGLFSNALNGLLPFLPPAADAAAKAPPAKPAKPEVAAFETPFEAMMNGFMRGLHGSPEAPPEEVPQAPASAEPRPNEWRPDDLARAGRRMQDDYARQMMDLFGAAAGVGGTGRPSTKH